MNRSDRARRIRDLVLAEAGLTLEASLSLAGNRFVSARRWRGKLSRERLAFDSTGEVEATKLTIWVDGEKTAVMAWTSELLHLVKYRRGKWETSHFDQPPYRNSAERWVEICSQAPTDPSVLALMRAATPQGALEVLS